MSAPGTTPGPWGWVVEDYSMASLVVLPDPGLGDPLVMTVSPCKSCQSRANGEWEWGRCHTPSEADARLIAASPALYDALEKCLALIDDMSRFVGQMSLRDYALFNEAPMNASAALAAARSETSDVSPRSTDDGGVTNG